EFPHEERRDLLEERRYGDPPHGGSIGLRRVLDLHTAGIGKEDHRLPARPVDGDAEYREDQGIFPFFGTIWTVNIADDANSVSRAVTPEALRNEGTIGKPVVSPAADKRVYFVSSGVSTDYPKLGIFHPSTGDISTVDITDIGPYGLHDLVVSPDGTRVYTNSGHVFDTGGTPVLLEDRLQASGYRITASPSGHQLYVFDNGVMTVLDSDTGSRVGDPVFLAINSAIVSRSGTLYTSVWGDAPAPTSVQTLWETLQEFAQGNDDSGGIYIQTVRDNEGDNRMIVYLGGTDDFWGGGNQGVAENGPTAALRAVKDDQRERIQKAVSDCERSAQCGSIAEIMIVGYSQGGMDAQNLARE
ncbi:MAG: hypothetical protein U1C73_19230, partial [Dietzia sp.]|nr:hypothetical protein [Dietzia sp.]